MATKYAGIGLAQVTTKNSDLVQDLAMAILFEEKSWISVGDHFFGLFELKDGRDKKLSWDKLRAIYPLKNMDNLAHSYLKACATFENAHIFSGSYKLNKEPAFNLEIWSTINRSRKRSKNVWPVPKPVLNDPKKNQKKRQKPLDFSETHGDMANVPTTKEDDGSRHIKTTPEQFPLAGYEGDWLWKSEGYNSFEEVNEAIRKRTKRDRVKINWQKVNNYIIHGTTAKREFRLYLRPVTDHPHWEFGFKVSLMWRDMRGWHEDTGGNYNGLYSAMAYCEDKLAEIDQNIIRYTDADCTVIMD